MRNFFGSSLFFILTACSSLQKQEAVELALVDWDTSESQIRIESSRHKKDFFALSNHFETQNNALVCGLASSAIVLNALKLGGDTFIPEDRTSIQKEEKKHLPKGFSPYLKKFTQNNVFNQRSKSKLELLGKPILIKGKRKSDFGLQLKQLAELLSSNGAHVQLRVADKMLSDEQIKAEMLQNLSEPDNYILVNYKRAALGQKGGGHISPLGAYHAASDSFLIMDVNPNRAPWVWVPSQMLISAMRTFDTLENRGYLLVQ